MTRTSSCLILSLLLASGTTLTAQQLTSGRRYGAHTVTRPLQLDSVNSHDLKFSLNALLKPPFEPNGRSSTIIKAGSNGFFAVKNQPGKLTLSTYSFSLSPHLHQGYTQALRPSALCSLCRRSTAGLDGRSARQLRYRTCPHHSSDSPSHTQGLDRQEPL